MQENKYWQSLEELKIDNNQQLDKEFPEEIPSLQGILEPITENPTNRRDFLKTLGFTVGAATIAAGCSIPERKSIPYVSRPDNIMPGIATYYASVFAQGGDYVSVLVKSRDGRPIKIEGNKTSSISKGGTTALAQASVVSLYDSKRHQNPKIVGKDSDWKTVDAEISSKLNSIKNAGGKVALLTGTQMSPSTNALIFEFLSKNPNAYHVTTDAYSYSGLIDATEKSFGAKTLPDYRFEHADVIVSIGADFLASWINPVEYAEAYSTRRKVSKENTNMSHHIQVESLPSPSSATADVRVSVSAADEAKFAAELYNALTSGSSSSIQGLNEVKNTLLEAKNAGKSVLVINGSNDVNVQVVTYAINHWMGSVGKTLFVGSKVNYAKGTDAEMSRLMSDLNSGALKGIIIAECNPVYSLPNGEEFGAKIAKLDLSVSTSDKIDETSSVCHYICPNNNYLESWNDYEPKDGVYSIAQPVIAPLFNTRQFQESLMTWSGINGKFYDYIRNVAKGIKTAFSQYDSFDAFWDYTLQNGEISNTRSESTSSFSADVTSAIGQVMASYPKSEVELKIYKSVQGDGQFADNPYIQELPDPTSRMTWENYFIANPKWMEDKGIKTVLNEKKYTKITLNVNGKDMTLPVVPVAGVHYGTIGVKVGYGRTKASNEAYLLGANAYKYMSSLSGNSSFVGKNVKVTSTSAGFEEMGSVQSYFTLTHKGLGGEKTRQLIKETTLEEYKSNPEAGNTIQGKGRKEWIEHHLVTLYPEHEVHAHQWGMVIDLNSCVGCGACVVACSIENNVPVVGKNEVFRSHDMHWLRIDRYHSGDVNNPDVTFQPMLCQHCDNAPCENVCPVSATNHSNEGLNQMAYNRCIGTRYCANNCPYKVRRFNWFDYTGSDSFGPINDQDPLDRLDPISRMVLNPDVVTRSRGVIEKCSFCVQRIQSGKLEAKKATRELQDGDIKTACQTACPTHAITFGDVNNSNTEVYKLNSDERAFGVIEEIYTKPSVSYLTKVRNRKSVQTSDNHHS
jgi:molybdopterin-containing oxidoreductase family iron-sulfur binding subunit